MVREAEKRDLDEILELYLFLHEDSIPEKDMDADHAGSESSFDCERGGRTDRFILCLCDHTKPDKKRTFLCICRKCSNS